MRSDLCRPGDGWIVVTTDAGKTEVEEAHTNASKRGRPTGIGDLDACCGSCGHLFLHSIVQVEYNLHWLKNATHRLRVIL
jgi:hypothetical protein